MDALLSAAVGVVALAWLAAIVWLARTGGRWRD